MPGVKGMKWAKGKFFDYREYQRKWRKKNKSKLCRWCRGYGVDIKWGFCSLECYEKIKSKNKGKQ